MEIKMTAINTNTASLNAQYFLAKSNKEMESSMAKLSSGLKVNSAADDAAGLAIAGRMTSQIKGLNMAIKNANDTVALAQTAEGAMEEVTSMLQRMRELAVQASNGTMNDSDRKSLDAEVQALKTEIDRVAGTTQFNNQNLLDGSFAKSFQIGDKTGQTVDMSISDISTKGLGISGSVGSNSITGARLVIDNSNNLGIDADIAAGDVMINGQAIGALSVGDDMEKILKAINDNVNNVVATASNVVVAKSKGTGITAAGEFDIEVKGYGVSTATTYNISASGSMSELVANINSETGGTVQASVNTDGKLVLSNNTGVAIKVTDNSASGGATNDGGSGFGGTTAEFFKGFITLTSTDGSAVTVERGNLSDATPGTDTMLNALGFMEVTNETATDKYTITGNILTDDSTAWGTNDIMINDVAIYDSSIATTTFQGRLDAINSFSDQTGVVASAYYETLLDLTNFYGAADEDTTDDIYINGVDSGAVGADVAKFASSVNTKTDEHGIKATVFGNNVKLEGANVVNMRMELRSSAGLLEGASGNVAEALIDNATGGPALKARIRLDSTVNEPIRIQLGENASASIAEHGFLEANVGAADFDVNKARIDGNDSAVRGLSVSTNAGASAALTTLDKAIDSINASRGDLGAIQNRLDHTVNNLSSVTNATEGAMGRIMDTDFATETANLTKQQILSQAATSMLAQANQSKQGILALLQG
jgi:flagellin